MREDCKYYLPCGYYRDEVKILCNGKIARGNHEKEALDNDTQSSSKKIYEHVMMEVFLLVN